MININIRLSKLTAVISKKAYLCELNCGTHMRPLLESLSASTRLVLLFLFLLFGLILTGGLVAVIGLPLSPNEDGGVAMLYVSTVIQSILVIAGPAILLVYLTEKRPFEFLKITQNRKLSEKMLFALMVYIVSYPFVSLLGLLNSKMVLPEALSELENILRSMEDAAMETTQLILSMTSIGGVFLNLLVIALLAAVTEEIFFRGALQQILQKWFGNDHLAIWITGAVFSLIHFQFYGFLPRMILGILLGYLFLYTSNLWVAIFFHFVNNASVILSHLFWGDVKWFRELDELPITLPYLLIAFIGAVSVLLLFRFYRKMDMRVSNNNTRQTN